ncbi:arginine ABC transporter substrate-binding protein [soil metagenome]
MKIIFSLFLCLLLTCYFPLSNAQLKPLVFATDATYPPFETYDPSSTSIVGYDIDIANALCQQMLIKCKFIHVSFNEIFKGLNQGKYDAIISAVSITPARQKLYDFTAPYYIATGSFVALTSSNLDLTAPKLANSHIGVLGGTAFEAYLKAKYNNLLNIHPYQHIEEALADLSSQKINIVLGDTPVITNWIANQNPGEYKIIGVAAPDKNIFGTGVGIVVRKNNKELLNALNNALATIKKNGNYNKITQEYFGPED